jgi:hypothetical protein
MKVGHEAERRDKGGRNGEKDKYTIGGLGVFDERAMEMTKYEWDGTER